MNSAEPQQRNYARSSRMTVAAMVSLLMLGFALFIAEWASLPPQERAADAGQSVGILVGLVTAAIGIGCVYLVFPSVATRLQGKGKFGVFQFVSRVLGRLILLSQVCSAVLHFLLGGSFSLGSLAELGRLIMLLVALLAAFVSPFALLWSWLAK